MLAIFMLFQLGPKVDTTQVFPLVIRHMDRPRSMLDPEEMAFFGRF